MEFRCFVRGSRLVGACQRHTADYFPFLAESRRRLSQQLDAFHDEHVADAFPHPDCELARRHRACGACSDARGADTYDVYVTSAGTVRVLDFNPWGGSTLPLLFTWDELARLDGAPRWRGLTRCAASMQFVDAPCCCADAETCDEEFPVVRVVESPQGIRPGLRTGVPLELYDTSEGSALQDFISRHRDAATPGGREDDA